MLSVGFVFLTLLESVVSLNFASHQRQKVSRRLDRCTALVFALGYGFTIFQFILAK